VEATAAANRIIKIRPTKGEEKKLRSIPHGNQPVGVEFKDVHFKYEERNISVLGGVSLKVREEVWE
jgi:ABC-type transport system involved in cytochrome bd biosynthesis fused ATPase/permease subunit